MVKQYLAILIVGLSILFSSHGVGQTSNIILLSGGPAVYDPQDPELHDKSWANYVTPPGLLLKNGVIKPAATQEVWWFVYKPAYQARWTDDLQAQDHRKNSVKEVQDAGYSSYVDLIEKKAQQRNWNLRWITSANEFWEKMNTFKDPIDKVYYWGHARDSLWLTCTHDAQHAASAPAAGAKIQISQIKDNRALKPKFIAGKKEHCEFWGCNTADFAKEWTNQYKTKSFGFDGKVDFAAIHQTGGTPSFSANTKKVYDP